MLEYLLFLAIINLFPAEPATDFEAQTLDQNVAIGYGLAIGDVDGDRKPDILLADKKQFVWYRNGDWKRFVIVDNLTESDNVCIAARDIDGDGKVEVAVGAQWVPSETSDTLKSGSVHYLIRPSDPTQLWKPVKLHHEPTVHRMKWIRAGNKFHLIVVPLHGRGNKNGEGEGVNVIAYEMPKDAKASWRMQTIDHSMHMTHNLDVIPEADHELLYIGGKEGVKVFSFSGGTWTPGPSEGWVVQGRSFGEVRITGPAATLVSGIEPMHGNELTVYSGKNLTRTVLTSELNQGHALAVTDLLGSGVPQVLVGWREPNSEKKTGIKMYIPPVDPSGKWTHVWIDDNGIACEDIQVADLDGDGKKDIISAGRSSHNLKIYWNRHVK